MPPQYAAPPTTLGAARAISKSRVTVVKVGSALISECDEFSMEGLAADIRMQPWNTVLVSSGAVAVGRELVPTLDPSEMSDRHALSAIGQAALIRKWQAAFFTQDLVAAQVLLTPDVTDDRRRYLNARTAMRALFAHRVVPIVNENDAVTTREFRFGDNDRLGAKTAGLVGADLLIILSDIDGLYTGNPNTDPDARHVPFVPFGEAGKYLEAAGDEGSGVGTGGMRAKLAAARIAIDWGVTTIIASGRRTHPIRDVLTGEARATVFEAGDKASARRRWLAGVHERTGAVQIDEGAVDALRKEASLLSVGILKVLEPFHEGDIIEVKHDDQVVAFGLAHIDSGEIDKTERSQIVLRRDDLVRTMEDLDDPH